MPRRSVFICKQRPTCGVADAVRTSKFEVKKDVNLSAKIFIFLITGEAVKVLSPFVWTGQSWLITPNSFVVLYFPY